MKVLEHKLIKTEKRNIVRKTISTMTLSLITLLASINLTLASGSSYTEGNFELPGLQVKVSRFFMGGLSGPDTVWFSATLGFEIKVNEDEKILDKSYVLYLGKKHYFTTVENKANLTIKYTEKDKKKYDTEYVTFVYKLQHAGKSETITKKVKLELKEAKQPVEEYTLPKDSE